MHRQSLTSWQDIKAILRSQTKTHFITLEEQIDKKFSPTAQRQKMLPNKVTIEMTINHN